MLQIGPRNQQMLKKDLQPSEAVSGEWFGGPGRPQYRSPFHREITDWKRLRGLQSAGHLQQRDCQRGQQLYSWYNQVSKPKSNSRNVVISHRIGLDTCDCYSWHSRWFQKCIQIKFSTCGLIFLCQGWDLGWIIKFSADMFWNRFEISCGRFLLDPSVGSNCNFFRKKNFRFYTPSKC